MFWKKIQNVLMCILIVVMLFAIAKIYSIIKEYSSAREIYKEVQNFVTIEEEDIEAETTESASAEVQTTEESVITAETAEEKEPYIFYGRSPKVDFSSVQKINDDVAGWIYAPGTNINYPVLQGTDNEYYLNHMINGAENISGSIFMEVQNNKEFQDTNTIIYGHHMKDASMFANLLYYKKQDYYETHPVMWLNTPGKNYKVEIFAGFEVTANSDIWKIGFESDEDYNIWLNDVKSRSVFTSEVNPGTNDRILTLSTCNSSYDEYRFVVMGILREQ